MTMYGHYTDPNHCISSAAVDMINNIGWDLAVKAAKADLSGTSFELDCVDRLNLRRRVNLRRALKATGSSFLDLIPKMGSHRRSLRENRPAWLVDNNDCPF